MTTQPTQTKRIDNPGLTARPRATEAPKPEAPPADEPEGELDPVITTKPVEPAPDASAVPKQTNVAVLSKAYLAFGDPVQKITFRRPVGRDLKIGGRPLRPVYDSAGKQIDLEYDEDRIFKYISLLSSPPIPPTTVEQLEIDDFYECAAAVASFFLGPSSTRS